MGWRWLKRTDWAIPNRGFSQPQLDSTGGFTPRGWSVVHFFQRVGGQERWIASTRIHLKMRVSVLGRERPLIIEVLDLGVAGLPGLIQIPNLLIGNSLRLRVFAGDSRHEAEFSVFGKSHNEMGKTRVPDLPDLLTLSLRAHEAPDLVEPFMHIILCQLEVNPQYLTLNFSR